MIIENLSALKINKLTQEQYNREYDAGHIDETALYLVPDEDNVDQEYSPQSENAQSGKAVAEALSNAIESGELKGDKGDKGENGKDGYTPQKGVDYYTESDKAEIVTAVLESLPNGDEVSY